MEDRKEEDFEKLKISELMDIYKGISDDESCDYMNVFWQRFPMDVLEDQHQGYEKEFNKLKERMIVLEKDMVAQHRIIKRIDRLTVVMERLIVAMKRQKK